MRIFGNWKVTRIRIQCADVRDHAKILLLDGRGKEYAEALGHLICGTSKLYICKPHDRSPIGKCVLCGGKLSFEIQHVEPQPEGAAEFEFAGLQVRRTGPEDMELAREWTELDEGHAGVVKPMFWTIQSKWVQSYLVSDGDGPLYFFTGHLVPGKMLEMFVQFAPVAQLHTIENQRALRGRTMRALMEGMTWLETRMRGVAPEICFETTNPDLARFCRKRMGFEERGGKLCRTVGARTRTEG